MEGLKAALADGRKGGRRRKLSEADEAVGPAMLKHPTIPRGGDRRAPLREPDDILRVLSCRAPVIRLERWVPDADPSAAPLALPLDWTQLSVAIRFGRAQSR